MNQGGGKDLAAAAGILENKPKEEPKPEAKPTPMASGNSKMNMANMANVYDIMNAPSLSSKCRINYSFFFVSI